MNMGIRLEHVNYIYSPDNAFRKQALRDVNLEIREGEFIGLIGHYRFRKIHIDSAFKRFAESNGWQNLL